MCKKTHLNITNLFIMSTDLNSIIKTDIQTKYSNINSNVINLISSTIKTIVAFIVQLTCKVSNNPDERLREKIIYKIKAENQIIYDLKHTSDTNPICIDVSIYIWNTYSSNKRKSISNNLIKKINNVANYYYYKFVNKKPTEKLVTSIIKNTFDTSVASIIFKNINNNVNDSDSSSCNSDSFQINKHNNTDIFNTQLSSDNIENLLNNKKSIKKNNNIVNNDSGNEFNDIVDSISDNEIDINMHNEFNNDNIPFIRLISTQRVSFN